MSIFLILQYFFVFVSFLKGWFLYVLSSVSEFLAFLLRILPKPPQKKPKKKTQKNRKCLLLHSEDEDVKTSHLTKGSAQHVTAGADSDDHERRQHHSPGSFRVACVRGRYAKRAPKNYYGKFLTRHINFHPQSEPKLLKIFSRLKKKKKKKKKGNVQKI